MEAAKQMETEEDPAETDTNGEKLLPSSGGYINIFFFFSLSSSLSCLMDQNVSLRDISFFPLHCQCCLTSISRPAV